MKINNHQIDDFNDIIGHQELFAKNKIFDLIIHQKHIINLILCGPSGIGKTSILNLLIKKLDVDVLDFNPLTDKKEKLVQFIQAPSLLKKVVLINEIHNMNKDKQDILLEALETKRIFLFASTNTNPYFSLNKALISRSFLILLNEISKQDLMLGLNHFVKKIKCKRDYTQVIDLISKYLWHDVRKAINTLILIINLYDDSKEFDLNDITQFIKNNQIFVSNNSDEFHDLKSAFHKSLRGSDPDASLYYLYQLIKVGDYQAIYRRLIACCYEDVGLANPNLSIRVMSAINACEFLGAAEAFQVLAFITVDIALSQKSNSTYQALTEVKTLIEEGCDYKCPNYLKNGSLKYDDLIKDKTSYKYPHNFKNNWVKQQYLPNQIKNLKFYKPNLYSNYEQKILQYWNKVKNNE